MFHLEPYTPALSHVWDDTVRDSRNGTFLLHRAYMDYHAERFADRSLIVRNERDDIVALFPAADKRGTESNAIISHPGLTYGGLILPMNTNGPLVLDILSAIAEYWRNEGRHQLIYRCIPHIYHRVPAEDDIYALFRLGATFEECTLSCAWDTSSSPIRNENTRRNIARGRKNGITIAESSDWKNFHTMLTDNLAQRHNAAPVHSLNELELLSRRFPENIKLWTAIDVDGSLLAGSVVFLTETCAHTQYIASTPIGRDMRALAVLFDTLMAHYADKVRYFDFGTSNEDHGLILNDGLFRQKCGYGARAITYQAYSLKL